MYLNLIIDEIFWVFNLNMSFLSLSKANQTIKHSNVLHTELNGYKFKKVKNTFISLNDLL